MFFKKIATYDKIKFPQQANSMVGGTRRNWAYDFFFANQTENYINFNPTSTKIAKSHFFKKWTDDKIELTSRYVTVVGHRGVPYSEVSAIQRFSYKVLH